VDEALPRVLEALCETLDLVVAELWSSDDGGETVFCSHIHTSKALGDHGKWKKATSRIRLKAGEGMQGLVWETKAPAWRADVATATTSGRKALVMTLGITSNMAFPVMAGDECLGVIFLHSRRRLVQDRLLQDSLSSLGRDIGQFLLRERAEQALRESEERFRVAASATNDVIWDWDLRTGLVQWSEGVTRHFGYPLDDDGTPEVWWQDEIHPEDRDEVLASLISAIESGDNLWTGEYRFRKADGTFAYIMDRGNVIRDAQGTAVRMIGAMQDVTPRKQWEETLRQVNATLEQRVLERTAELEALTVRLRLLATELTQAEQRERRRLAQLIHDHLQQLLVASKMRVAGAVTTLEDGISLELLYVVM
jgi:PAS domain S-box-containing protein